MRACHAFIEEVHNLKYSYVFVFCISILQIHSSFFTCCQGLPCPRQCTSVLHQGGTKTDSQHPTQRGSQNQNINPNTKINTNTQELTDPHGAQKLAHNTQRRSQNQNMSSTPCGSSYKASSSSACPTL